MGVSFTWKTYRMIGRDVYSLISSEGLLPERDLDDVDLVSVVRLERLDGSREGHEEGRCKVGKG